MSADPTQPPVPPPPPTEPMPAQSGDRPPDDRGGRSFWVIVAIVVAILVIAGVIAAIALSGDDGPAITTSPTGGTVPAATGPTQATGATATGSTGATGATEPTAANLGCTGGPAPDSLPDGEYFGFIKSMNTSDQTMAFDLACFYTGEEANEEAAARGDEVPVPNDVYIVNDNTKVRTLTFDPSAKLRLIDWNQCCEFAAGAEMQAFASAVDSGDFAEFNGFRYAGTMSPYWVTIQDGRVVRIEEQFLP